MHIKFLRKSKCIPRKCKQKFRHDRTTEAPVRIPLILIHNSRSDIKILKRVNRPTSA